MRTSFAPTTVLHPLTIKSRFVKDTILAGIVLNLLFDSEMVFQISLNFFTLSQESIHDELTSQMKFELFSTWLSFNLKSVFVHHLTEKNVNEMSV